MKSKKKSESSFGALLEFLSGMKEKFKKAFSSSDEQIKIENQRVIVQEEINRLEGLKELILKERDNVTIKKVIRSKEETDKLKQFNKAAQEIGIDTEYIEGKLRVALEESWVNLRDYEVLTVIIEALDNKVEKIKNDPEKFLKGTELGRVDQMIEG